MADSSLHILIVDDSPEDRYTVRRLLRADPRIVTITEADRGDRTLAICQTTPPDCVLLDYHLPDMDGLEVLARLRTQRDVPVVLLTGVGNESLAVDALHRGAQDYTRRQSHGGQPGCLRVHRKPCAGLLCDDTGYDERLLAHALRLR
ncbi:MAG: response regulator [Chloroflexales bacterium]